MTPDEELIVIESARPFKDAPPEKLSQVIVALATRCARLRQEGHRDFPHYAGMLYAAVTMQSERFYGKKT